VIKTQNKPRFLMCRPEHYGVHYAINPWMDPHGWSRDDRSLMTAAHREWSALHRTLRQLGAAIELVPPLDGQPDLVFTANGAVVLDRTALLARFRHDERRGEQAPFEAAFRLLQTRGLIDSVKTLPNGIVLEGAGDCVFDEARRCFWLGHGPRSDIAARGIVAETFGVDVVALELADPRFYHMDTALSALPRGEVMYFPGAFTAGGRAVIQDRVSPDQRIEITEKDACRLAANAVCLDDILVMGGCSARLHDVLAERGYRLAVTPLKAYLRSGGSAFCLTLRLDRRSRTVGAWSSMQSMAGGKATG
jgi:N-dimethylarginine dimethylaminohydrolase